MSKFVIEQAKNGVKFNLTADNGEIIAVSEVYSSAAACRKGIEGLRKSAATGKIADLTQPGKAVTNPKFELYQDKRGAYRFRLKARNGEVVASSEPYGTKSACQHGIESVIRSAQDAQIEYD